MASELGAESLALTGNWEYQASSANTDQLVERYAADFSHHLDLTELMALDATIRYNRLSESEEQRQDVVPSFSYLINNDLFLFNLSGSADEELNDSPRNRHNRSLAANWNSVWEKQAWLPTMSLNLNQNWQGDDLETQRQDSESKGGGGSLDWDLALARVFYRFNTHENDDLESGSRSLANNQLARVETDASFWGGRGTVSLSQQLAYGSNENRARLEGGIALIPVSVSAYSGEALPTPVILSLNSSLTDGDKEVTAVTVNNPLRPLNLGLGVNFRQVDRIYLYTDSVLSAATSAQFGWEFYSSNNNRDWTLERAQLLGTYNPIFRRFEFVVPAQDKEFLKLVAVRDPAITSVNFTEIEAYQAVTDTGQAIVVNDDQESRQTDANLALQLRPDLQLTSNVNYAQYKSSLSADVTNTNLNSGLTWTPAQEWSVRLNNALNTRDRDNDLADEAHSYGLMVGFPTLPTVDSVVGVTLSEYYEGGEKTTTGTNYTLQVIADLYTDLNARFNVSLNQFDAPLTETGSETASTQLNLTARLLPGLVADWSGTYTTFSDQDSTIASEARLNWRLTDRLSVDGRVNGSWGGTDLADIAGGFDLALTETMQLSLNQRREISPDPSNITSLDWRWAINQSLSMLTSGAFLYGGERDEWNITSRVNTRLTNW